MEDQELYYRAVKAYYRWCKRMGFIPQQPSWACSDVVWDDECCNAVINLENVNGPLAVYKWHGHTEKLVRVPLLEEVNA